MVRNLLTTLLILSLLITTTFARIEVETIDTLHFKGAEMSARKLNYLSGGNIIDDVLMVESQLATHGSDYSALDRIIDPKRSKHTGEESITAVSGASQYWSASKFYSPATHLIARTSVFLNQVHRQHFHQSTTGSAGGLFESGTKVTEQNQKATSVGVDFTAPPGPSRVKIEGQLGSIQITGAQFQVDHTSLSAVNGIVEILQGTNSELKATSTIDADAFWQTQISELEKHETFTSCGFRGMVEIHSQETLLERVQGQTLEFANRITQHGGKITYKELKEFHDHQSESKGGPTAGLSMVIALGVTLATGGATGLAMKAGTSLATTLGAQGTTASIITAMGAAGFTALCSQAAVQLVASKGNIFEAAKNLATAETLTNLALTMVTAGVLEGMSQQLGMGSTLPPAKEAATSGLKEGVKQAATQPASGTASVSFFQNSLNKGMDFLKREALKGAVGASVNAAFGQRVLAGDVLKTIGTSVLADVFASTGGDLHAEGTLSDAGQTAWHMGSGAVVGGLMGGTEGAIAAAGANLIADLAFKGLAPNKPTSLDPDEQKAYSDAIDRTAIAAKLLAPITVMFVTGGSAVATSTAIASSSAVVNENHMGIHSSGLTEEEQQIVDEKTKKVAKKIGGAVIIGTEQAAEFWENYGDQIAFAAEVIYCTRERAIGGVIDTSRLSRLQSRAFAGRGYTRVGAALPTKRSDPTRVSRHDAGGSSSGVGSSQAPVEKLRGSRNPKVREAAAIGRRAHNELKMKVKEKEHKGWEPEKRIPSSEPGKILIPDVKTPTGYIELKPNTKSGIQQGIRQARKYKEASGKKVKVIHYDPEDFRT